MTKPIRSALLTMLLVTLPAAFLQAQETGASKVETDDLTWKWVNFVILAVGLDI